MSIATEPAWAPVAEAAGLAPGTTLLDVGCGAGGFCAYARALGARVHGVDRDPEAVEAARRRMPAGDFRLGLMEALPWHDGAFDVVTGFNAFQYALDVRRALDEAYRVLRPGALLAVCKWGRPQDNAFFAFLGALGAGRVPAGTPDPIEAELRSHRIVAAGTVSAPMEFPDAAALEAALSRARISQPGELVDAAAPFRTAAGGYRFDNRLRYWILRAEPRPPVGHGAGTRHGR